MRLATSKKYFLLTFLLFSFFLIFLLTNNALAYSFGDIQGLYQKTGGEAGLSQKEFSLVVAGVINQVLTLIGAVFVVLFIYAGVSWMISGGTEDKINKAKKTMTYAIIGLLVIIAAYSITYFITLAIEQSGTGEQTAPTSTSNACNAAGGSCTNALSCTNAGGSIYPSTDCSQDQVCCLAPTPTAPTQLSCSDCGQGALNTCDATECKSISSTCYFCPGFIGGDCYSSLSNCQAQCSNPNTCY